MNLDYNHIPAFYEQEPCGVNLIVETVRGSAHKYAWKEEFGALELRRILRGGMVWPCDFGFIPQTLAEDGDSIDVALLIDEGTFPGCMVRARILGAIGLRKNGEQNDRLLACPISLPGSASTWDEVRSLEDVSPRRIREIEAFLRDHQTFEGNRIELTGVVGQDAAMKLVHEAARSWAKQHELS